MRIIKESCSEVDQLSPAAGRARAGSHLTTGGAVPSHVPSWTRTGVVGSRTSARRRLGKDPYQLAGIQHNDAECLGHSKRNHEVGLTATRVLIADDHDEVRRSIRQMLERTDDFAVVGEAVDGAQAIVEVGRLLPDLVIMDIFMPVLGGLQATTQIVQSWPQVRVVALTADPSMVMDALTAGATGCLLKGDPAASLMSALRAACGSPALARSAP